ncbi:oxalurate catabolism protein HpxZ [Viridibacterium curvum]|uniref:Oxalurate catabolism protein HpxZ n=2 Tax=Viridibacterium curvum TaxID=1101404 RepID=A0ABP9QW91_9RHOO
MGRQGQGDGVDNPVARAGLLAASDRYEAALLANDTATLDALFWHDARVMRIAAKDELRGIDRIRAFRANRSLNELAREYLSRDVVSFSDDAGVVNIVFRRQLDGQIGRQSQTWVRLAGEWRIVSAHISFRSP